MSDPPTPSPTPEERLVMAEPIESAGDGIKRLQADLALTQQRLTAAERTVREQREALDARDDLVKVLVGFIVEPGESWHGALKRVGLTISTPGYRTAMRIGAAALAPVADERTTE